MNTEQRHAEFNKIIEMLPGKNADKLRKICELLECGEVTARRWQTPKCNRPIPEHKIKILKKLMAIDIS